MEPVKNNAWRRMTMILLSVIITTGCGVLLYMYFRIDKGYLVAGGAFTFILLYFILQQLWELSVKAVTALFRVLENTPTETIVGGTLGLLVGVLLGMLSGIPFYNVPFVGTYIAVIIFLLFSYVGLRVGTARAGDLLHGNSLWRKNRDRDNVKKNVAVPSVRKKVVDTSAVIDGRIYDVAASGFLEGTLIIPKFVIEELQHIADSEDAVRRIKGRRGLDILSQMQKNENITVEILDDPVDEEREVDMSSCACAESTMRPSSPTITT